MKDATQVTLPAASNYPYFGVPRLCKNGPTGNTLPAFNLVLS